jgi:hypothetical protein
MTKLPFDFLPRMPPRLTGVGAWYLSEFPVGRFVQRLQRDLAGPALPLKIIRYARRANHLYKLAPSHPKEGRLAIVTNARWDAVDAAALGA